MEHKGHRSAGTEARGSGEARTTVLRHWTCQWPAGSGELWEAFGQGRVRTGASHQSQAAFLGALTPLCASFVKVGGFIPVLPKMRTHTHAHTLGHEQSTLTHHWPLHLPLLFAAPGLLSPGFALAVPLAVNIWTCLVTSRWVSSGQKVPTTCLVQLLAATVGGSHVRAERHLRWGPSWEGPTTGPEKGRTVLRGTDHRPGEGRTVLAGTEHRPGEGKDHPQGDRPQAQRRKDRPQGD